MTYLVIGVRSKAVESNYRLLHEITIFRVKLKTYLLLQEYSYIITLELDGPAPKGTVSS